MGTIHEMLQIERSLVMAAPRSRVWSALTEARQLARWFGVTIRRAGADLDALAEGRLAAGDTLEMVTTHPDHAGIRFPVFIELVQPERELAWRWFPGGSNPERTDREQTTLVTFTLEEVSGGTRVTVTESGFDRVALRDRARAYEDNLGGWQVQLGNLEQHVEA